ncbi:MAG: hypothetical protein GF368_01800 [Candidatus Aenigmarchaeota archaeon]|nr:hypothetical protein [Candidatus Aenigmarchaeota archaeon]
MKIKEDLRVLFYIPILILILASFGALYFSSVIKYQMRVYVNKKPIDFGYQEIKRCHSFTANFVCEYEVPITGMYFKAVTYEKGQVLSESDWRIVLNE